MEENNTSSTFRDFIPDGEDLGGLGNGFTDFVPTKKPEYIAEEESSEEEKKEAVKAKRLESLAKAREAKKQKESIVSDK